MRVANMVTWRCTAVWEGGRLQRSFFNRYDAERWLFRRLENSIDHPRAESITVEHVSTGEKLTLRTDGLQARLL
jgi:hypothetical protein